MSEGLPAIREGLADPHQRGRSLAMLRSALSRGWQIPDCWMDTLPVDVQRIAESDDATVRDRLRAAEIIVAMRRDNIAALVELAKNERLEAGDATERVEFRPLTFGP